MAEGYWVGLDIGYDNTSVAAVDHAGVVLLETTCQTTGRDVTAARDRARSALSTRRTHRSRDRLAAANCC